MLLLFTISLKFQYFILHGLEFLEIIFVLVLAFLTECNVITQCGKFFPYQVLPPKPGLCVHCECRPKPVLLSMLKEKVKGGF